MEENEDESDIVKAASVEEGISKGEAIDDFGRSSTTIESASRHQSDKDGAKKQKDTGPKTVSVWVYEKECTLPKSKPIPRHCLTKKEWIDMLATPSRKCPVPCPQREVSRKVRPVSTRIVELAQPPKTRLMNTLQDRAGTLPIELVDNLMRTLEGDACLTPEQAERMLRDKVIRPKKKCRKRKKKQSGKGTKRTKHEASDVSSIEEEVPVFEKEAPTRQYLMSESFVKSILEWRCPIPREKFKDIAEVILERLGRVTQYSPAKDEDRKVQQMQLLADIVASWISGVLCDVAEARKTKLSEYSDEEQEEDDKAKKDKDKEDDKGKKDKDGKDGDGAQPGPKPEDGESRGGGDDGKQGMKGPEDDDAKEPEEEDKSETKDPATDAEAEGGGEEEYQDARDESQASLEEKKTPVEEPEEPEDEPEDTLQDEIKDEPQDEDIDDTFVSNDKDEPEADEEATEAVEPSEIEENVEEAAVDEILESPEESEEPEAVDDNIVPEELPIEAPEELPIESAEELPIEAPEELPIESAEELPIEAPEELPIESAEEVAAEEPPEAIQEETPVDAPSPEDSAAPISLQESEKELQPEEEAKIVEPLPEPRTVRESSKRRPLKMPSSIASIDRKKFQTDTPFVTFDKIFHTIYNAIEASRENPGADVITNRLHRAVFEKCSNVVQEEKSEPLSELTKDVLDVLSGKIALWLRDILTESQLSFINKFPATVESVDVREWTTWIGNVSDTANTWSDWIQETIRQTEAMRAGKVTRGDWLDWTKSVDEDALLWRRFYVQSLHQAHQNLTMIRDRQVVKTGTKDLHQVDDGPEREMEIIDLETA